MSTERAAAAVAHGDTWRAELRSEGPGKTFLMIDIGGAPAAKIPVENIIRNAAFIDPAGADKDQNIIQALRQEVGDWKSKYFDQRANEMTITTLRGQLEGADRKTAAAVSELAFLRAHVSTPEIKAKYESLVLVVLATLRACPTCGGTGNELDGKEGMSGFHRPCATCGLLRQLVKAQAQP